MILQNLFKFESSQNQGTFLGSQKLIGVQVSNNRACTVNREIRASNKVCRNRGKHHISAYFSKDQILILQKSALEKNEKPAKADNLNVTKVCDFTKFYCT